MINYNEINDFIIKVFNYYNGKINPINKAVLDINWCNLNMCDAGGFSRLPNIVVINPMVITRFYYNDEFMIKIQILETIIHELYHSDQIINYQLYMSDINYNKFIEHSCELETVIYIAGHVQEIYNVFGIDIFIDKDRYNKLINYWYYPGVRYQRRNFNDHIFMCIDNLCDLGTETGNYIYKAMYNSIKDRKNITFYINDEIIPAYIDGNPVSTEVFNKSMGKYQCTGVYEPTYDINNHDDGNISIIIKMQPTNLMCKKV